MSGKFLARVFDRKLCALLDGPGIQESEFINEIVQSGAEIVYDLTNQDTDDGRGYILISQDQWTKRVRLASGVSTREHGFLAFEVFEVLLCPRYSSVSALKRWFHPLTVRID